jgi:hypothetical protein
VRILVLGGPNRFFTAAARKVKWEDVESQGADPGARNGATMERAIRESMRGLLPEF